MGPTPSSFVLVCSKNMPGLLNSLFALTLAGVLAQSEGADGGIVDPSLLLGGHPGPALPPGQHVQKHVLQGSH